MATNQAELAKFDERLSVAFGVIFPRLAEIKRRENRTGTWSDVDGLVPDGLVSTTDTEGKPKTDSQGREISPARLLFMALSGKYRPKNPKYGNAKVFGKLRAIQSRVNAASGIKRGRTSGVALSDDISDEIEESYNVDDI